MSFERYKTQVLLLHSEQSTLDDLCSGFNNDYSVHCESSGIDALNTLGDTPIHVFVSAQELPGMSGLDALREARKRSPDTTGILLAGPDKDDRLDALAAREGIQIVRGPVTSKSIFKLVEAVTKQDHTQTMAGLTFDRIAPPNEMRAEHIVIETSEHGETIISDGTANVPALKPGKIHAASDLSGRRVDVLVLTKDEEFFATIRSSAGKMHNVHHAVSQKLATDFARDNEIGVLVTDAGIAGDSIEVLTQKLRSYRPRLVAIVAGRRDDGEMLMDLINRGHVYRFLLKPVSPGRARLAIEASVKHHRDAPESAFRTKAKSASDVSRSAAKRRAASANRAPSKSSNSAAGRSAAGKKPQAAARTTPTISDSPIDDGLDNAFEAQNSFVETMTDVAGVLGKTVASILAGNKQDSAAQPDKAAVAARKAQKTTVAVSKPGKATGAGELPEKVAADAAAGAPVAMSSHKKFGMVGGSIAAAAIAAWLVIGWESVPDELAPTKTNVPQVVQSAVADTAPTLPAASSAQVAAAYSPPVQATAASPVLTVSKILLDSARAARDAGNLTAPAGSNAVALYLVALAESPGDPTLEAELKSVVSQVLGMAETAILEQSAERANEALAMARLAEPGNRRIAFLEVQVSQLSSQLELNEARVAIRERRFEDAERLIAAANNVTGVESANVNLVVQELAAARNLVLVESILVTAGERVESGLLLKPANDSARFHYELALAQDPGNQSALQGLTIVASGLVAQAGAAIDEGRLVVADDLLRDAAILNPSSNELAASYAALAAAREAVAEATRQAEAARLAEVERLAQLERQAEAAQLAELERLAEFERQAEAARLADLEQKAEIERQAAVARQEEIGRQADLTRQAETERLAELERQMERQRQAQIERQAQVDRLAVLEREAEVERQAELLRQAEVAKKAELVRLADIERQAEQDRLAEIARREAEARQAELREAEHQAVEQNAAVAAASSALGVAGSTVKRPPRNSAKAPRAPASNNQQVAQSQASDAAPVTTAPATEQPSANELAATTKVVVSAVEQSGRLPSTSLQAGMPTGLPQFAGASISKVGGFGSDGGSKEAAADEVLAISSFTRTNYEPPVYPRSAQRRNINGAVELEFTISAKGTVTDIRVLTSTPGDTFNQAAMNAVKKWRFEPFSENGRPVDKRTAVRLSFDLQ